ncbi:MAG: hypothetical protein IT371_14735 [Deltaproteobacteria bacterium]|nr:hypothetical protein [Deltaproteobacteria bacterium]
MPVRSRAAVTALLLAAGTLAPGCSARPARQKASAATGAPRDATEGAAPAPLPVLPPEQVRWIVIGGGSSPEYNQISIEQDVALAQEVLGAGGQAFVAGGPGHRAVQVLGRTGLRAGDPLARVLGELFNPRGGRESRYQRSRLGLVGASTYAEVQAAVDRAAQAGRAPLLLLLNGHGDRGNQAADNSVGLWGQSKLTAKELAEWLDGATRPVRVLVTTCYGGGFAELAFAQADPKKGAAPGARCGFFATTEDLPATGCDPSPDRAAHEGYAVYFFNALRGRSPSGQPLPRERVDTNRDGKISLIEAHNWVRVASSAPDVPTSTSERWLRAVAPKSGRRVAVELPEEERVIASLAASTKQAADPTAVHARLDALEDEIDKVRTQRDEASQTEDTAAHALAGELLARWPVLDDPWHPDFASTLARHRQAISRLVHASPRYADYQTARKAVDDADAAYWALRRLAAPVERLARAMDTVEFAERLKAKGGADWHTYARLLACERGLP